MSCVALDTTCAPVRALVHYLPAYLIQQRRRSGHDDVINVRRCDERPTQFQLFSRVIHVFILVVLCIELMRYYLVSRFIHAKETP